MNRSNWLQARAVSIVSIVILFLLTADSLRILGPSAQAQFIFHQSIIAARDAVARVGEKLIKYRNDTGRWPTGPTVGDAMGRLLDHYHEMNLGDWNSRKDFSSYNRRGEIQFHKDPAGHTIVDGILFEYANDASRPPQPPFILICQKAKTGASILLWSDGKVEVVYEYQMPKENLGVGMMRDQLTYPAAMWWSLRGGLGLVCVVGLIWTTLVRRGRKMGDSGDGPCPINSGH